ncbi:MAG: NusG domain II-containing protein, partial [Oscillospiraceae bacterium]
MQASKPFFKRADIILVICVALLCVILFLPKLFISNTSPVAVIFKNGEEIERIKLESVSDSYTIDLGTNPSSVLQVEKGRIRYKSADCHDKLCVKSGWLSKAGDTAA